MAESTNLYPSVEVPQIKSESEMYNTEYRPSVQWDLAAGDFKRTAANRVPESDGVEAYKIWCIKTVYTERDSCLAYSTDIGTEMEAAEQESDRKAVELALNRTISEAILVNPRTISVSDFSFAWEPDSVHVSFIVRSVDVDPFTVDATLELS